jgi:flagellar motor protein MotB
VSKKEHKEEESGEKVPIWIISFADMITLLLSFFVMLQTMASRRDDKLFSIAQDSFRRSLAGFGIPDLIFGKQSATDFNYRKIKYPSLEADPNRASRVRVINSEDDAIRLAFSQMKKTMESKVSQAAEVTLQVINTPLRFDGPSDRLLDADQQYLGEMAINLQQSLGSQAVKIYVIANSPGTHKEDWLLAAQRATAVEKSLRRLLAPQLQGASSWELVSAGSGPQASLPGTSGSISRPLITLTIVGKASEHGRR